MAFEKAINNDSVLASADLSANQYKVHKLDSNGELVLCGAGELAYGVLQDKPDARGKVGQVMTDGITKAQVGGAVAAGAPLASDASGLLVTAGTGDYITAQAREAAAGTGEWISVKLRIGSGQVN